jgi:hypothetical protein
VFDTPLPSHGSGHGLSTVLAPITNPPQSLSVTVNGWGKAWFTNRSSPTITLCRSLSLGVTESTPVGRTRMFSFVRRHTAHVFCTHYCLHIPLTRGLFECDSPLPSQNMEISKIDPLQCCECEGVLLPDRPIPLKNESWVLRYVCIDCKSRSYAVKDGSAIRMYP